jgi:hypothetical protein
MNKQETIPQILFFLHQETRVRYALIQSRNGLQVCIKQTKGIVQDLLEFMDKYFFLILLNRNQGYGK